MLEDDQFDLWLKNEASRITKMVFGNPEMFLDTRDTVDPRYCDAPWLCNDGELNACLDSMELQMMGIKP